MFDQFLLHQRLVKSLVQQGFQEPTSVQLAALPPALAGRDLRVIAQTGSGKTAAFVLPVLQRLLGDGASKPRTQIRALLVLPTRELAQQILNAVRLFAQYTFLKAEVVTGGEDFKVQAALLRRAPDILVGTPGRLNEHLSAGTLLLGGVEVLVFDEADRMLDMGFADDVGRITAACTQRQQTLLYSATSGGGALREAVQAVLRNPLHLKLNQVSELSPNIVQQIITVDDLAHKERVLGWLLTHEFYAKAIVFTNTRARADALYQQITAQGIKVFIVHSEKDQKERKRVMQAVRQSGACVLLATDVAARGLDIEGLNLVVNFDLPHSGDDYVHRVGRTARAGASGVAISLIGADDWRWMSSIERYLKQRFHKRVIAGLKGVYQGPKALKASGKPVGAKSKNSKEHKARSGPLAASKKPRTNLAQKPQPQSSNDGYAPPTKHASQKNQIPERSA